MTRANRQKLNITIALLFITLCLVAVFLYESRKSPAKTTVAPSPTEVVTFSTDTPSEALVDPSSEYNVPSNHPRRIIIPDMNTSGFIQKVGIDQTGAIAVPANINLAGWYTNNVIPGNAGVSLIDGHSGGRYQDGIFKRLAVLNPGDKYQIEFGDLSIKEFEVVSVTSYKVNEVIKHMLKKHAGIDKQLNLVTCGGRYDAKTRQYVERVLVVSKAE